MTKWGAAPLVAVALVLATGCSSGGGSTSADRPTGSPKSALAELLRDEQHGDHAGSFQHLSDESRRTFADADEWARLRTQLPAITGFTVTSVDGDNVVAVVQHEPGLDPFVGLSPARTRETWRARAEHGTWRFDAAPRVRDELPPSKAAVGTALTWARAVQACDRDRTMSLQAVTRVFGLSRGAEQLCGATGTLAATTTDLPAGPQTADLVAQYTSDALTWARAVRIDGAPVPFSVVLAPIGDTWKVVAVFDGQ